MKYCHCPNQDGKRIASGCDDCGGVVTVTGWLSKPTHGGTRPNAGRKPRAVPRVPITVRLEPMDAEKLKQECKRLGVSQAEWVAGKVNREK